MWKDGWFKASKLEGAIKSVLNWKLGPGNEGDNCAIWEAGRATSTAPRFFKRIEIGRPGMKEEFIDAAMGCNNPTKQLMAEAEAVFGDFRDVACIVSIGTGKPKVTGFKKPLFWQRFIPLDLIEALKEMATNSESTAEQMATNYKHLKSYIID